MLEWPGKCAICSKQIEDWATTGLDDRDRWVHKVCYQNSIESAVNAGATVAELRSPVERSRTLEWPMLAALLGFHFGIGVAFIGWIMLTQDVDTSRDTIGMVLLAIGLITTISGVFGVAMNIRGRRRIELVRQALELSGGWKPSR